MNRHWNGCPDLSPMLMTRDFILFGLLLGGIIWGWAVSLRARERALTACRRICREFDMQLLDHTVALNGIRLARDEGGRLCLQRRYIFEFSPDGHSRYTGRLFLLGPKPLHAQLDLPDGTSLVSPTGRLLENESRFLE